MALILVLIPPAGCQNRDPSTPEGLINRFMAEVRSENWAGIFDLLGPEGRDYAEKDFPGFKASEGRDSFAIAVQRVISARPGSKDVLVKNYGKSSASGFQGQADGRIVKLKQDDGGSETLFVKRIDGTWRLVRFPVDWSSAR